MDYTEKRLEIGEQAVLNKDINQPRRIFRKGEVGVVTRNQIIEFSYVLRFVDGDELPVYNYEIERVNAQPMIPNVDQLSYL